MELVIGSSNKNKLKEIKQFLGKDISIKSLLDFPNLVDVEETGISYEENALLKAQNIMENLSIDSCISDDSGINIESFKGKYLTHLTEVPGIYSARYSSAVLNKPELDHDNDMNNKLVLEQLVGENNLKATYVSVICYLDKNGVTKYFRGEMEGRITFDEKGTNGFAYDTIFLPLLKDGTYSEITYAEMENEEKNKYSHRVKAIKLLMEYLNNIN